MASSLTLPVVVDRRSRHSRRLATGPKRRWRSLNRPALALAASLWLGAVTHSGAAESTDWPAWRGPEGTGLAPPAANPPTNWSAEQGIAWKVALPGPGNASPVVVGTRVFLTQFDPESRDRILMCLDLQSGSERWRFADREEEDEWTHPNNPLCSATPACDGERVVAFLGASGLVCCDLEGNVQWQKSWGAPQHLFGAGPSPVIVDGICIVTFGPGREQFHAGLNMDSGEELWRIPMPRIDAVNPLEGPNAPPLPKETDLRDPFGSWATPLVVRTDQRTEVVLAMPGELRAIAPRTGDTLWSFAGLPAQVLGSPSFGQDTVVMQSGIAAAIQPGGEGNLSESSARWTVENDPSRIGSPVIVDGRVYGITMNGIIDCRDLNDGSVVWRERLRAGDGRGGAWTSLVASGQHVYALTQSGTTFVFRTSDAYEQIAENPLGESTNASPAIAGDRILIRTSDHLWCIQGDSSPNERG